MLTATCGINKHTVCNGKWSGWIKGCGNSCHSLCCCCCCCCCRSRATVLFAYAISISRQLQSSNACQTQTQCKPKPKEKEKEREREKAREGPVTGLPHIECLLTTANKVNARQRAFILDIKRKRIRHLKCPTCRTAGSKARTEVPRWETEAGTGTGTGAAIEAATEVEATVGIVVVVDCT